MRKLVAVVGPTATGKTDLALRLALAFEGEIVGADSRQVYRWMDVGTAKPTAEQRALVPHWLVDAAAPDEDFGLAQYLDLALAALEDIWSRGRLPLLVGGTGQYVWALLEGWQVPRVGPDRALRRELEERARREGPEALLAEVAALDPEAARSLDRRNVRRLVRALLSRGYRPDLPAMSGIGYRQVCQHLTGELSLEEAVARTKRETHRLARHQRNWFRRDDQRIHWIGVSEADPLEEALGVVESELSLRKGGRE